MIRKIKNLLMTLGLDFSKLFLSLANVPKYLKDRRAFLSATKFGDLGFPIKKWYPMLIDHLNESGVAKGHYFHQDLFVARRIFQENPKRHIDIASRVDGFVAHLAVFRHVDVADIRPLTTSAKNINFLQCDILDATSVEQLGGSDSVSCLHSIEHFGLGRYGDPIMIDGHEVALRNLARMVNAEGVLYVSAPIGEQRIEFNGHRVFKPDTIPNLLADEFTLEDFSFIDDNGEFHENVKFDDAQVAKNFGCNFGCGIYELRKGAAE